MTPPDRLRAALLAYIQSVPNRERLDAFFREHAIEDDTARKQIAAPLDAIVRDIERFMARLREPFTDARFDDLATQLRKRHSWLDEASFTRLRGFANWYAWHEGLSEK